MRRDEYEELQRLEAEYRQRLEEMQKTLNRLSNGLKNAGLEIDRKGIVRRSDNAPANASVAPTYQTELLAQARSYEVKTRMADVEAVAIDGIRTVIKVCSEIESYESIPLPLKNQLREIQEEVKKAINFVIAQHAGYAANNGYYR